MVPFDSCPRVPDGASKGDPTTSSWPPRRITCLVEQSNVPHLLVVSVEDPSGQRFRGALIADAVGGGSSASLFPHSRTFTDLASSAVERRYTYQHHQVLDEQQQSPKAGRTRGNDGKARTFTSRPNVRLRARQVLCRSCRSVCDERGENVQQRRRKVAVKTETEEVWKRKAKLFSLVPRVKRLSAREIDMYSLNHDAKARKKKTPNPVVKIRITNLLVNNPPWKGDERLNEKAVDVKLREDNNVVGNESHRKLRKKRSATGSMEDLWDESVLIDSCTSRTKDNRKFPPSHIMKSEIGRRNELQVSYKSSQQKQFVVEDNRKLTSRAARNSLKKARREVQRRLAGRRSSSGWITSKTFSGSLSPSRSLNLSGSSSQVSSATYSVVLPSNELDECMGKLVIKRDGRCPPVDDRHVGGTSSLREMSACDDRNTSGSTCDSQQGVTHGDRNSGSPLEKATLELLQSPPQGHC